MKKIRIIGYSVFLMGCGTLGSIGEMIVFPASKNRLSIAMDTLYSRHPEYKIPEKWEGFDDWSKAGYDFLEGKVFYFKSPPEEMYYVTFIGDSETLADTTKIGIGIRAIYNGNYKGRWLLADSLNSKETKRVETRFNKEIISRLEEYSKTKAKRESF
jgi:hypothetical protein